MGSDEFADDLLRDAGILPNELEDGFVSDEEGESTEESTEEESTEEAASEETSDQGDELALLKASLAEKDESLVRMQETVDRLSNAVASPDKLRQLLQDLGSKNPVSSESGGDDQDLTYLTNEQLHEKVLKTVDGKLSKRDSDMQAEFKNFAQSLKMLAAQTDLQLTQLRHSDLQGKLKDKDYVKAFSNVAKDHPDWGAEQVYNQVAEREELEELRRERTVQKEQAKSKGAETEKQGRVPKTTSPEITSIRGGVVAAVRESLRESTEG